MARPRGSGRVRYRLHISIYGRNSYSTIITIGPSLTGLRGTQPMGSISYTHVNHTVYDHTSSHGLPHLCTSSSPNRVPNNGPTKLEHTKYPLHILPSRLFLFSKLTLCIIFRSWYVSNVSIIFDAPCLFLHHLLSVLLHFVAFLCIFRNWPINKMPQCQFPIFCYFCVSEKLHKKYFRNWTKQKPNLLIFTEVSRSPKRRRRGDMGRPHHRATRPAPGPRPLWVRPPWSTSEATPSPIKTPRREKPKHSINFLETHRDRSRVQKLFQAPCRRGKSPLEVFFIAMLAFGAMSE
jgi:hypothetical protein